MKFTESQLNEAKNTLSKRSLSTDAKNEMLKNIYNSTEAQSQNGIVSPWGNYFTFFKQKSFLIAAALILMLTSTTYASAVSLPGDFLYPVKTDVIEPLVLTFKITPESKTKYQEKLVQKRIMEQEKLAVINEKQITTIDATISTTTNESKDSTPTTTKKIRVVTTSSEVNINITTDNIDASTTVDINNISTTTKEVEEILKDSSKKVTDDSKKVVEKVSDKTSETVKETVKEVSEVKDTVKESVGNVLGL